MDRLSESGAIAGSKEPWTCRAAVAPLPRTAPPRPDGRASLSPDPASPAARDPRGCSSPFPRRASLRRRLRPRDNAATLLRGARGSCLRQFVRSRCRAGACCFAAACLLLLAVLTFPVAASAQTDIWTATLTVGKFGGTGFCSNSTSAGACTSPSGSLSDDDFILDGTTYTVESIRWGSSPTDRLHLTLDRDFPAGSLATLTLEVGSGSFALSAASRGNSDGDVDNNYKWSPFPVALVLLRFDDTVTVTLVSSTTVANAAPTVANPIDDQTATAGTALNYEFPANTFNDTDAGDTLTYTATQSDDSALPAWLTFDAATRTFSGTPQTADVGTVSVKVTASDGTDSVSDTFDIVVSTAANSAPVFATDTTARNFTETVGDAAVSTAGEVGAVVTATDADGSDMLTYSLEGTDMAKFGIVSGSGQIRTLVGEKYDREAKGSYSVTVKADDNHGGTDTIAVTITVDNAVEKPVAPAMPAVTATSGSTTSLDVSWMAPANAGRPAITGYQVEYRPGVSGNWLPHVHTGTATTATIASLTAATAYQVQVLAVNADGDGAWSSPPGSGTTGANSAPVFATDTTARNFTETVGDAAVSTAGEVGAVVTATDADGSDMLTYSLEGTDMAKFGIVSGSGQIRTLVGEKYDREAKGSYSVTVKADDNHGGTDTIAVTITVDNAVEKPVAPAMPAVTATSGSTTSLDVSWMAPANAGRPAITGYQVEYRPGVSGNWLPHVHTGTATTATIASLTAATAYQVQVLAVNADGDGAWSSPPGSGTTGANSAPVFADATASRNFTETVGDAAVSTAGEVGAVVTATDADGSDMLAYSLEGTDMAKFGIVSGSGQIRTLVGEKYDREAKGSYSVTVKADDNHGGTDTIAVTITVDNAVEKPVAPAMPAVTATSGSTTSLDVSWMAPANAGRPAITGYQVEYRPGVSGNWLPHVHTGTATTATIASLTAATAYQVQVLAVNADGDGAWSSPPGSGTTGANSAPVFATDTTARNFTETVGDAAVSTAGEVGAVVTATDADGSDMLTYSLEGTDMAKFGIVSGSGQIRTLVGEKYDREAKGSYSVTVKADDNHGGTDTIAVTITVDNAVEKPVAPAMPAVTATSGSTTSLDVSWMAPANAGRPAITGYQVEYRPGVSGNWLPHVHTGTATTATIASLTAATAYQVQVLAVNADGDGAWSSPPGSGTTGANSAPVFATDTTARNFTETVGDAAVSTAGEVGAVVTATDADGSDMLTYSLEGTDMAKFGIVSGSGQIRTLVGEKYDREAKGSYSVTVKADDNHGGTDTIAVTITVDNAVEKPVAPAMPAVTATSGSTTSLDVSWMAPANAGRPAITGYQVEYRPGVSGNWLPHVHTGTATTATIASLTAATAYQVQVLAVNADGDGAWSSPPGSGTTGANSAPVFATDTTARNFTETVGDAAVSTAGEVGAVVTATDADGSDTLAYSLEGTDMAKFGIVSGSGQIRTLVGEKYDREAKGSYSVTVKADDNHGGTDTIAVTITVDNAVEKPVAPAMPAVTATSGSTTSLDVSWMAPANAGRPAITGYQVEYRPGVSGNWLPHVHTGTATTATIASLTAATAYQVQVLAVNADGDGAWSSPPGSGTTGANSAPVFATDTTARNFTETVGDAAVSTAGEVGAVVTATDADGSDMLTYSLEGTDMAKFGIVSGSGQIRTLVGEKYDREAKGSYSVTVKADDNHGGTDTIAVTITVDNAVEKPVAPAMPAVTATSGSTTSLDVSWMAPANAGRPAITGYQVEYRPGVSGNWLPHVHTGTATTATIASLTAATAYQVQVLAVNADGDGAWSSPPGSGTTGANSAPVFATDTTARNFTETVGDAAVSTAGEVGAVVTATDADGSDTLAYSLEGTDMAKFGIVSGSGQIRTLVGEKYDREAKGSYSVTVKADDNHGGTDTIAVTITVDNAVEKPVAPAMPAVTATSGSTTSLDVSWMAPANAGRPAITGYKVEYRAGVSGNWLPHVHTGTATTATIASLTAATAYQVQVLAVNADGDGAWSSPPGTGTTGTATNNVPTVANAISDETATAGTALSYAFPANTFADTDASDTLTYTATKSDDSALPSWLSFAPATRTFSGTPMAADVGRVSVKVTASDGTDSVSDTFDIVVSAAVPGSANVLVSNAGQGNDDNSSSSSDRAQAFTTSAGATLSSVEIKSEDTDDVAVSLCTVDGSNHPTSSCTPLTAPSSFAAGTLVFTAPANTTLTANTTYSLLVTSPGDEFLILDATHSDNEDAGGATGWSIANTFASKNTSNVWVNSNRALRITIKGMITVSTNTAPTGADNTVTMAVDRSYTFVADEFGFADTDAGDTLESVRIVTLPASGTLVFDGTAVVPDVVVTKAQLDHIHPLYHLTFTPAAGASGDPYASFTFKVNDGTDDSAAAYTMSITVNAIGAVSTAEVPHNWALKPADIGAGEQFRLMFQARDGHTATPTDIATYNNHVRSDGGAGVTALRSYADDFRALVSTQAVNVRTNTMTRATDTDVPIYWARSGTVAADDRVAANYADFYDGSWATGGTGYTADGYSRLLDEHVTWTGSNANGTTHSTGYMGSSSDIAYWAVSSSGGISVWTSNSPSSRYAILALSPVFQVATDNSAPTGADNTVETGEDRGYTFDAEDFGFEDDDGDTLASVKIVTLPSPGTLALAGAAVLVDAVVTKADIDDGDLIFTPVAGASGAPYTSFTFKVNDGTGDSVDAYTMSITVSAAGTVSPAEVPGDWALKPADIAAGGQFRLMFQSSAGLAATSTDIAVYDTWVRTHAAAGVTAIQPYANDFTALVSTQTVNARTNTLTRATDTDVPIYWVRSGPVAADDRVADDYADFYDGLWATGGDRYSEGGGFGLLSAAITWTGSNPNGSTHSTGYMGSSPDVAYWTVPSSGAVQAYLTRSSDNYGILGLSSVFQVATTLVNTAPTGADSTVETAQNTAYAFAAADFGFADTDLADALNSVRIVTPPALGTLALDGTEVMADDIVTKAQLDDGELTFTPVPGATGAPYASFTFKVNDGRDDSAIAYTMSITVNTVPTGADNTVETAQDTAYAFMADDFGFEDDDAGDTLDSVRIVTPPALGTLALDGTEVMADDVVTKAQLDDGELTFTPVPGATGEPYTNFTFKVNDGTVDSASAYTMSITVNAAPTGADKMVTIAEDTTYPFKADDFGFADTDAGDTLESVKIESLPALGRLALGGTSVALDDVVNRAQIDGGMVTFTPVAGATGDPYASFTFKVNDGTDDSASAYTMSIAVSAASTASTAEVPFNWALKPADIGGGEQFRLMFVTGGGHVATSADIADYNTFVRTRATQGLVAIRPYANDFTALVSTQTVNVRTNTLTRATDTDVPIYWVERPGTVAAYDRVADDYADFYDGSWPTGVNGHNEGGYDLVLDRDLFWTGSNPNGSTHSTGYLGSSFDIVYWSVSSSVSALSSSNSSRFLRIGGLSPVFQVASSVNNVPTGANMTVTTGEDRPYTFTADDFEFNDADADDTLASVRIVAPPALGTLALDGTAVMADDVVTKAQIDGNMLTFTPVAGASGDPYTSFTFKVNDGTEDSVDAYTMSITVSAAGTVSTAEVPGDWALKPADIAPEGNSG